MFGHKGSILPSSFFGQLASRLCCPVCLQNEKDFALLLLLKEMRMLSESEILSFFIYGVN